MKSFCLITLAVMAATCGSAFAATIPLSSITATASSEHTAIVGEETIVDSASNTIDGILALENWWRSDWQTDGDPWIEWEFDDIYVVNSMQVANYFESGQMGRAMKNVDVYVKRGSWVYLKTVTLNQRLSWQGVGWTDTITIGTSCTAVKFDPRDNYNAPTYWTPPYPVAPGDADAMTGLMEVSFDGAIDTGPFTCGDVFHPIPPFDSNDDCVIDLTDLVAFAAEWLTDVRP